MDNYQKLLNNSYRFLSIRPRSEKEIKDYLVKKKASLSVIDQIIDKLKEHRFLDDREFTEWWIEQRTKIKPRAWKLIQYELKGKGINEEIIEEVHSSSLIVHDDLKMAIKLAEKRLPRYKHEERQKKYEKMSRFLASKGFNYGVIKEVIDQILGKRYNIDGQ